ncbi:MAG: SDR family oxidoreductase [Opitutales bacterium]
MKILLTGATGLLGHAIGRRARRRGHAVLALHHRSPSTPEAGWEPLAIDLSDPGRVVRPALDAWPDAIINAAAVAHPGTAETDPARAEALNVALPRQLAQVSFHLGARFIHLSSDQVFAGDHPPYHPTDLPEPVNAYGRQKLKAEREVLEHHPEGPVVLRLPLILGNSPSGRRSVHESLLRRIRDGDRPVLFTDEWRQPASADGVADTVIELAERRDLGGLFHWAGKDRVDRYTLGRRILETFGLPGDWVEAGKRPGPERPADLTLDLRPLVGKLRNRPETLDRQLAGLRLPADLLGWHHAVTRGT